MEDSEKVLFVSKSTPSSKPSFTGSEENNENDSSQNKTITKFQSNKKMAAKNFMSPTISAATKAVSPRKKILAERNDCSNISDAQDHKRVNLETKKGIRSSSFISHSDRYSSRIVSSYDRDDYVDTNNVDDLCVKGYDPLSNYLSPRPKYLRFNPNRRREILNRLEKEDLEVEDEVESALLAEEIKDSSFSPTKESCEEVKNDENFEEKDEIVSNNDEVEEEEEEEEVDERGWCFKGVLKLMLTLVACLLSTSYICSMNTPSPSPTQLAFMNYKDGYVMIKNQTLELISMTNSGFLEVGDGYSEVEEVEIYEDDNGETEESVEAEIAEDCVVNLERGEELVGDDYSEVEEVEIYEEDIGETEESIEAEIVEDDVQNLERIEKVDKAEEIEAVRGDEFEFETKNFDEMIAPKTDESSFCLGKENVDKIETDSVSGAEVESETESFRPLVDEKTDELHEMLTDSVDEVGFDNEVGWKTTSAAIGVFMTSIIVTSLGMIFHSKKARNTSVEQSEQPVLKKVAPVVLPSTQRKIEFSARPSSLSSHSMEEEAPAEVLNHHIRAPTVELIGEIVVGQMSSLGGKKQMTKSEEINATKPEPVSTPTQLSTLEFSTNNSSSFGGAERKKILNKEGGQSGESSIVESTPVRRSSRLRNRAAVMSP